MFVNTTTTRTVPEADVALYIKVCELFDLFANATRNGRSKKLPGHLSRISEIIAECHTIATAISMLLPELKVRHGMFVGIECVDSRHSCTTCAHSWNVAPGGTIIDAYPVGVISGGPIMMVSTGTYKPFGSGLYFECPLEMSNLPMYKIWNRAALIADVVLYAQNISK